MKTYKKTTCNFCGMKVNAELIRQDFGEDVYRCPNTGAKGNYHIFTKKTGIIKALGYSKWIRRAILWFP